MKKIIICFLLCASVLNAADKNKKENFDKFFTGGMIFALGIPLIDSIPNAKVLTGIGGRAHLNFFKLLRIGIAGMGTGFSYDNSTVDYNSVEINYGGATIEIMFRVQRFRFAFGAVIGGGAVKHFEFTGGVGPSFTVNYTYDVTFIAIPMVTMEFLITDTLSLTFVADFFMGSNIKNQAYLGPRFALGVMFNK